MELEKNSQEKRKKVYRTPHLSTVDYLTPQPMKPDVPHPQPFKNLTNNTPNGFFLFLPFLFISEKSLKNHKIEVKFS